MTHECVIRCFEIAPPQIFTEFGVTRLADMAKLEVVADNQSGDFLLVADGEPLALFKAPKGVRQNAWPVA
jgi:hypothetical protein